VHTSPHVSDVQRTHRRQTGWLCATFDDHGCGQTGGLPQSLWDAVRYPASKCMRIRPSLTRSIALNPQPLRKTPDRNARLSPISAVVSAIHRCLNADEGSFFHGLRLLHQKWRRANRQWQSVLNRAKRNYNVDMVSKEAYRGRASLHTNLLIIPFSYRHSALTALTK